MIPAVVTDPASGQPVVVASLERQRLGLEKEITEACNEFLNEPDWNKNMSIVDQLNRAPYLCPFAIKAIRVQLKTKNPEIEILALQLTETIIKNCPSSHAAVAQEDFMRYLVKVGTDDRQGGKWTQLKTKIKKKNQSINSKHIRSQCIEKALLLLKMLAMGYSDSNLYPVFRATVRQLEEQKVRFPETNKDESLTIFSPIHSGGGAMGSVQNPNLPMIRPVVLLEDVTHYELVQAQESALLLFSMINAPVLSYELIPDLTQMLNQSQQRIVVMISEGTVDETVVMKALQVNDIVNQVLEDAQAIVNGTKRRYQEEVDVKKLMKRQDSDGNIDGKDDDDVSLEHSISLEEDKDKYALSAPTQDKLTKKRPSRKTGKRKSEDLLGLTNNGNDLMSAMNDASKEKEESEGNIMDFLGVNNEEKDMDKDTDKAQNENKMNAQIDVFDPLADIDDNTVLNNGNAPNAQQSNMDKGNESVLDVLTQQAPKQEYDIGGNGNGNGNDPFKGMDDPFAGMSPADKPKANLEPKGDPFADMKGSAFDDPSMKGNQHKIKAKPKAHIKSKHQQQDSNSVILDMFTTGASPDPNDKPSVLVEDKAATVNPFAINNGNIAQKKEDNPFDALENPFTESLIPSGGGALAGNPQNDDVNPFAVDANNEQNKKEEFMGDRDPFAGM